VTSHDIIIYDIIMRKMLLLTILFIFTVLLYSESLKVAAVQLEVSDHTYRTFDNFREQMELNVRKAVETFNPDLIIFPEYTSVFPAITPYYDYIGMSHSVEDIFQKIHNANPAIMTLKDLFVEESGRVTELMDFWGKLSEKYSVTILGGSYFASEGDILTNRLVVYGPDGNRIYEQDKFFLTDFETDIISLSSGDYSKPEGLTIKGKKVAFTICRDTFLDRWESMYEGVDLWIDIKANGEFFTDDQRELFSRALPARMEDSNVEYGVTVCLTGQFLELFWEGESSMIKKINGSVHTFITSDQYRSNEILYFVVD